ncbi:hypothetical protein R3I94_015914 [Phoxinus phoxinus]
MSDRFVKPGNQEHGWNDPPQFSYGLQKDPGGPKRNLLNKRVHAPQLTGPGSEMQSAPAAGVTPPRGMNAPPLDRTAPDTSPRRPSDVTAETEPCIEDVQEPLYWALNACRHTVKVKSLCEMLKIKFRGLIYNRCVRTKQALKEAYATSDA